MVRMRHRIARLFAILALPAMAATTMGGCIKDDLEDCPPVIEEYMIVTAYDSGSGADITISQRVVDGSLFFFDGRNQVDTLMEYISVDKSALGKLKPIPLLQNGRVAPGDTVFISAWGNIEGNIHVIGTYDIGQYIADPFLNIMTDTVYTEYYQCPGEILFGMREIVFGEIQDRRYDRYEFSETGELRLVHEIPITQLNAMLSIQVEDLPEGFNADDYYFEVKKQNNGYNYEGAPLSGDTLREMRLSGVNQNGYFMTSDPYNFVPTIDSDGTIDDNSATVLHLFRSTNTRAEDIDLTGEVLKTTYGEGDYIGLYSGKTTNVRIRFPEDGPGTGEIQVDVQITPWGQVYQWETWNK